MTLMPIVYVTDMDRSLEFYTALGNFDVTSRSEMWSEVRVGERAVVALHKAESLPEGQPTVLELSFTTQERLEGVVERLKHSGITSEGGIKEEDFGRLVVFKDPDGLFVQISEEAAS